MGLRCCLVTLRIPHFGGLFPFSAYFSIFFCPLGAYLRSRALLIQPLVNLLKRWEGV